MRNRIVAIDCGTTRNAVGAFAPTSDGSLVLVEFSLLPLEPGTGGEPAWLRPFETVFSGDGPLRRGGGAILLAPPPPLTLSKPIQVAAGGSLPAEVARSIPYPLGEVAWAVEPLQDSHTEGDFVLSALKLEIAEGLCAIARHHRREVTHILPAGLALAWACRHNYPEIEGMGLVVDLAPRAATLVCVGAGRRLLVRTVGLAPRRVTERVAVGAGAGEAAGEDPGPDEAIAGQVERLALEINRCMAVWGLARDAKPEVILLAGETVELEEFAARLAARTGRPVERFDPLRQVQVGPGAAGAVGLAHQLAVVVGLAASVAAEYPAVANLLPPRLQQAAARRRRYPLWLTAGAFAVAALFPLGFGNWRSAQVCRERASWLDARIAPLREIDRRNQAAVQAIADTQAEILRLHRLLAARASWCRLLDDLQGRLLQVDDAWLERLEVVPAAAPPGHRREATLFAPPSPADRRGEDGALRLRIAGRLLERQRPTDRVGAAARERVASLMRALATMAFVRAIEDERFDDSQSGQLRFECTLVLDPANPL